MDIQYLLLLQDFRNSTNGVLDPFMSLITKLSISFIPLVCLCIVYWVFDKKSGTFLIMNLAGGGFINGIIKLTACVYRPWIRDARIIPAGDSIVAATGYSFPSGHSTSATAVYGGPALVLWKKHRRISIALIVLMLLTFFSRNYLGVHTPQDVLVGFIATAAVIYLNVVLLKWIEKKPERDLIFLIAIVAAAVLVLIYINVKSYPMDYVNGKLLVDPEAMKPNTYEGVGGMLGFAVGWFIERRFIKFEILKDKKKPVIVSIIGCILLLLWEQYGSIFFMMFLSKSITKMIIRFGLLFIVMAVVPLAIKLISGNNEATVRN